MITISVGFILSCIAVTILYVKVGMPKASAGIAFLGIAGLGGFSLLIFKKDKRQVTFDERDLLIQKKAKAASYTAFWVLFVVAAMVPFFILGPEGVISVKVLPAMIIGGIVVLVLVESIVTLTEYGRGGKENE